MVDGLKKSEAFELEWHYYTILQRMLGEQKIDIITLATGTTVLPIHKVALQTGIRLRVKKKIYYKKSNIFSFSG